MPDALLHTDLSLYVLYLLLFLVGISLGSDKKTLRVLKTANIKILLIPLSVVVGTGIGVVATSFLVPRVSIRESLAVGAGFGYYSLSSILIAKIHSDVLGVIALLSNIIREIFTLLFTPLLARWLSKISPVASGGATAMDTTLPIINRFCGHEYAMIAVLSGLVLSLLVPLLVPFILGTG
jgi:uncharacterized membrane protein YbjE (DUF340 family)